MHVGVQSTIYLDRNFLTVVSDRAMDLSDGRGGDGDGVELSERLFQRQANLGLNLRLDLLRRTAPATYALT